MEIYKEKHLYNGILNIYRITTVTLSTVTHNNQLPAVLTDKNASQIIWHQDGSQQPPRGHITNTILTSLIRDKK